MPWEVGDVDKHIKGLTDKQKKVWVEVANKALQSCLDEGGEQDTCEASAIKQADTVAKNVKEESRGLLTFILDGIRALFDPLMERAWDGSASNYDSTEAFCSACLIDVNKAAGLDEKTQSHCMLPVKASGSGTYDTDGCHAAAVRFNQVKRPADVPEEAWGTAVKSAANKLISAYSSFDEVAPEVVYKVAGKERPEERAITLQLVFDQIMGALEESGRWAWIHDVYREDDGSLFAVMSEAGKLYRVPVNIAGSTATLGTWVEVTEAFPPATVRTSTIIMRQTDGRYRWLSVSATAVLNRVGEIDSTSLFDSFVMHATETGEYPYRTFYHQGECMRTGQCDFLAREGVCLITSGLYDDSELAQAEIEALQRDAGTWGESIGYLPTVPPQMVGVAGDVTVPVYSAGILREISFLPQDRAASWFTAVGVMEVKRMRKEVFDALVELCGGDEAKARKLAESADGLNREVAEGGLIARAGEPTQETPAQKPEPQPQEPPEVEREIELDEAAMALIAQQFDVKLAGILAPFTEKLDALTKALDELRGVEQQAREAVDTRIKALEATDDEKRHVWSSDLPRRERLIVTHRPREANADAEKPAPEPDPAATALAKVKAAKGNL